MTSPNAVDFICNVCGRAGSLPAESFDREAGLCPHCQSTVRARSVIYLLTKYLLGEPRTLPSVPPAAFRGVGLSCAHSYAPYLEKIFHYTNTYFDHEPRLDISHPANFHELDFLISSDVFEHTFPPAIAAFQGASSILKPGGLLILSVPYTLNDRTVEHYPECIDYEKVPQENGLVGVRLTFRDGSKRLDTKPVWHGGQGNTLEMRVYCRSHLFECLKNSSFEILEEFAYGVPHYGIITNLKETWSLPLAARKL
ncbi:MAG: hypothetical protein A3F68_03150 [Acidobacteria bacterium RIFCSPLOWO2_12_FULL_54_10]|nr:MAG: hypothetical protein A3F68_03150 [Acidobacteria bacterium RIFCSPLOWO2_12_FULL_54_10]